MSTARDLPDLQTKVPVIVKPEPMTGDFRMWAADVGMNLQEIVDQAPGLPTRDPAHLVVHINGEPEMGVPAWQWPFVKPRKGSGAIVTVAVKARGGGDLFDLAGLLLAATSALLTTVNPFLALGVSIVGSRILQELAPSPEGPDMSFESGAPAGDSPAAGARVNTPRLLQQIPAVCGTMRVAPPPIMRPYRDLEKGEQVVYAAFGFQGRHEMVDTEVNGTPSTDHEDVQVVTREGLATDTNISFDGEELITVREESFNLEMPRFKTRDGLELVDQVDIASNRSDAITVTTGVDVDEFWLNFHMPIGLSAIGDFGAGVETAATVGGIRIEIKRHGTTTWRKVPEFRVYDLTQAGSRFQLKFVWAAAPGTDPFTFVSPLDVGHPPFARTLRDVVKTNADDPGNVDWLADPYFGTTGTDGLNIERPDNSVNGRALFIYLDPADATNPWPVDQYDFRIQVGCYFGKLLTFGGAHFDVEDNAGTFQLIAQPNNNSDQEQIRGVLALEFTSSVWREYPWSAPEIATVAIKAKELQVNDVTVKATGYTNIWNGTDWNTVAKTDNPAAWFRRSLLDGFHAHPLPNAVLDDANLGAWYDSNVTKGYQFNALITSGTVENMLSLTSMAGEANLRRGPKWGVWIDQDRAADDVSQIFSPNNAANVMFSRPFDDVPEALRISWADSANKFERNEKLVLREGFVGTPSIVEEVNLKGKVTEAEVDAWGRYFLRIREHRDLNVQLDVGLENLHSTRGDLVGLNDEVLVAEHGSAYIEEVVLNGAQDAVVGLVLHQALPLNALNNIWAEASIWDDTNIWALAGSSGIKIRKSDGMFVTSSILEVDDTDTVTLSNPIPTAGIEQGLLVVSGPIANITERMIIANIVGKADDIATLTLIPDASPQIFAT